METYEYRWVALLADGYVREFRAVLTAEEAAAKYDEAAARLREFAKTLNEES